METTDGSENLTGILTFQYILSLLTLRAKQEWYIYQNDFSNIIAPTSSYNIKQLCHQPDRNLIDRAKMVQCQSLLGLAELIVSPKDLCIP